MTTSAVRTDAAVRRGGRRTGFTLLEIVVVMGVVALLFTAGLAGFYLSDDDRQLREASQELEVLAKRARTIATLEQKPYAIEFYDGGVRLMPFAEALMEPTERELVLEMREEGGGEVPAASSKNSWQADEDMSLSIQRWGNDQWFEVSRRSRHLWRFDPSGLCEPIAVRFDMDKSWMVVRFHPLTAAIADEEGEIH
jgi:prepilin-type N-terminal cleavage/methylation domain-containing protein